ncbi:hypothetical protein D0Z08_04775 [Nocardioides immobilis]|uniref:Uncharacterized protein n=1 Tax=Nocardioides immobilis TaxID=2049295 RepID=A0A417Y735_9ACTN|nr:hypothetical protein [Nocardioides immobilis]RHW28294.1 hypothetical protein D0Z08_04775 [Nocardioides immobilis]
MRRAATRAVDDSGEWGRRRLLGIFVTAVLVAGLVLAGMVYAVHLALAGIGDDTTAAPGVALGETEHSTVAEGADRRDEIAAEPMLQVPEKAAFPADPSSEDAPSIQIPTGSGIPGPGLVMTGFPHTPEGAIGQLAQIDVAVLQAMSLHTADEVYRSWALPGGVAPEDWWITASVRAFLSSTQMGDVKDPDSSVTVEPAAALVKGTDGSDWVTVCVLMKVTATYRQEGQIAFGHCERMQWAGGRWMIAPGIPPAPAPSTWPGTDAALQAGWRNWVTEHSDHSIHPEGEQ